jgi:uncharacterized protein (TIGR00730 family)
MKHIAVYLASSMPANQNFITATRELGRELAMAGHAVVYGGGNVGLMGVLADAVLAAGGVVIGVIPESLQKLEVAHDRLSKLHVVQDMSTRKTIMRELADAYIILPGGFGTLDEFFDVLTLRQLKLHNKPIIVINIDGYFDHLLQFIDQAMHAGMLHAGHVALFSVVNSAEQAVAILRG